jgi:hypothetical protein
MIDKQQIPREIVETWLTPKVWNQHYDRDDLHISSHVRSKKSMTTAHGQSTTLITAMTQTKQTGSYFYIYTIIAAGKVCTILASVNPSNAIHTFPAFVANGTRISTLTQYRIYSNSSKPTQTNVFTDPTEAFVLVQRLAKLLAKIHSHLLLSNQPPQTPRTTIPATMPSIATKRPALAIDTSVPKTKPEIPDTDASDTRSTRAHAPTLQLDSLSYHSGTPPSPA